VYDTGKYGDAIDRAEEAGACRMAWNRRGAGSAYVQERP